MRISFYSWFSQSYKCRSWGRSLRQMAWLLMCTFFNWEQKTLVFTCVFLNCNLMVTQFLIHSDYVDHRCACFNYLYIIITSRYWILERSSDFIEATIQCTHAPNKIFNLSYMLLERFFCEYVLGPPWAFTLLNTIILQHTTDLIHYDLWFMWCIYWHFTTYRWGWYGVDHEFVPEYFQMRALFVETFPLLFIILMSLYLESADAVSPILITLVNSFQSSTWLYVII